MKTKHTPGPWSLESRTEQIRGSCRATKHAVVKYEKNIALPLVICDVRGGQLATPDAQLITAAPELLAALIRCQVYLSAANDNTFPHNFIVDINNAINKARGES